MSIVRKLKGLYYLLIKMQFELQFNRYKHPISFLNIVINKYNDNDSN